MSAGGRLGLSVHPSVGCALDDCALVDIVRKMAADGGPVSPLWSENTFDSFCVVAHEELSKMPAQKEIQQLPPLKCDCSHSREIERAFCCSLLLYCTWDFCLCV